MKMLFQEMQQRMNHTEPGLMEKIKRSYRTWYFPLSLNELNGYNPYGKHAPYYNQDLIIKYVEHMRKHNNTKVNEICETITSLAADLHGHQIHQLAINDNRLVITNEFNIMIRSVSWWVAMSSWIWAKDQRIRDANLILNLFGIASWYGNRGCDSHCEKILNKIIAESNYIAEHLA